MQKVDKEKIWQEVYEKLQKSEAVFVVNYQGIKVESMNELRRSLKNAQGEIKVVKNTLARIALDKAGIPYDDELMRGQNAFAFSYLDAVQIAKLLADAGKKLPQLEVKGGWLNRNPLKPEEIKRLAQLPSREQLIAQVVGGMKAPITGLVGVLQGLLRSLVGVLQAIEEKKNAQKED
ncbi:MAG TPA: 50S ribosomal protein L10 [Candidatus Atribacteria bacterium]|uniref:50S ribosomal protein L10 n=1 Tax=Candidatus Sordicultor fermentans TaxID=1953203 RepID=UPI0016A5F2D2|nr:50S ribosomal protein L10 [Atribacterota bacterium]NLY05185.1 50S ribosomal protein L10 [Candidatus Atribacteria bacterium]MDI9608497.1 50S ribosomal protein L10 [Atribacterota bacterium]MDY0135315.1 50S ribosomal protein L10 [Atribacterota bacterium]HOA99091.1 50S ribosomal protein L10 [Candidatus Atribacteria bacterium]